MRRALSSGQRMAVALAATAGLTWRTTIAAFWLSPSRFVMVSDLCKGYYEKRCGKRDQSIHIFRLPTRTRR
jgi:hypothetical protein